MIADSYQTFPRERKGTPKITTTWHKETGRIALIMMSDFPELSGKSLTSRNSESPVITQTIHTNVVGLFRDAGYYI